MRLQQTAVQEGWETTCLSVELLAWQLSPHTLRFMEADATGCISADHARLTTSIADQSPEGGPGQCTQVPPFPHEKALM